MVAKSECTSTVELEDGMIVRASTTREIAQWCSANTGNIVALVSPDDIAEISPPPARGTAHYGTYSHDKPPPASIYAAALECEGSHEHAIASVWEHARAWERERIARMCDAAAEEQDWESARTAIEDLASTIRKGEWRAL
jgi:hypothetical protein